MSMVLSFLTRQTIIGDQNGSIDYYSEIFDVSAYAELESELRVFAVLAASTTIDVDVEGTNDPRLADWQVLSSFSQATAKDEQQLTSSKLLRFVRVKATINTAKQAVIEVVGVARESS